MKDELSDFDNQTAELMLFIAGELPSPKQQEMRARLERDANLRQKLKQLQDLQQQSFDAMQKLDETEVSPTRDRTASQLAQKAVSQWTVRRLMAPPLQSRTGRQIPWSRYAVSAAAAIILAGMIWPLYFSRQHGPDMTPIPTHILSYEEKRTLLEDKTLMLDDTAMNDKGSDLQFAASIVQKDDSDLNSPTQQ
jgi:hypothetical protein